VPGVTLDRVSDFYKRARSPRPLRAAAAPSDGGAAPRLRCANCHESLPDVQVRRLPFVGERPFCDFCTRSLNEMGYSIESPASPSAVSPAAEEAAGGDSKGSTPRRPERGGRRPTALRGA